MKSVYKYEIPVSGQILMPVGSKVLKVAAVGLDVFLWVSVETSNPDIARHFHVVNTGDELPSYKIGYLDTVMFHNGLIVKHVFESLREGRNE